MAIDKYSGFYKSGGIILRAEKCDWPRWRNIIKFKKNDTGYRVIRSVITCNFLKKYYVKINDQEAKELLNGYEEI